MDALLSRLGVQAINYAIRSGLALTSTYAISQCSRLLKTVDDKGLSSELKTLQKLLNSKIQIISPAIDLIEFKSGRGNPFLESAVPHAKSLHREIVCLGKRLESAATSEEDSRASGGKTKTAAHHEQELRSIISGLQGLLERIDRDIPLLQFAIIASGESLAASMPPGVSPSRLLQASKFLFIGDTQYADTTKSVQIGPSFNLSLYMLFVGHSNQSADASQATKKSGYSTPQTPGTPQKTGEDAEEPYGFEEGARKPIWQEVIHKARVRLCRTPINFEFDPTAGYRSRRDIGCGTSIGSDNTPAQLFVPDEFSYHLEVVEDLNDGRVHDVEDSHRQSYDTISLAGIRESIPIHQLSKIFYTDTGRILNIGNSTEGDNNPVLLLKRDKHAEPPTRMAEKLADREPLVYHAPQVNQVMDSDTDSDTVDEQDDIDRQLRGESRASNGLKSRDESTSEKFRWNLPSHLDPEWIALEVFEEDESDSDESDNDEPETRSQPKISRGTSLDSRLIDQIRNISVRSSSGPRHSSSYSSSRKSSQDLTTERGLVEGSQELLVARSPFGAITSSLSLLEMLIRLTSLQEFQQMSHLSIPDYILTFFLEETSTTGLTGEEKWKARSEAKRRVGFDPYTDTPT